MDLKLEASFLDIFKAFDKVSHTDLSFKFLQNGISGNPLNILSTVLSNIKQTFVFNGQT